jgi:hypothetical protein
MNAINFNTALEASLPANLKSVLSEISGGFYQPVSH